MTMKFATAEAAGHPKTDTVPTIALFLAGILVVMAVSQLFSFEKFIPLIESYGLPGGHGTAALVASLIAITEVFALPFLLRMKLSPLMRVVSMVCGWLVIGIWLVLAVWANSGQSTPAAIGFLGASIHVPVGWWAVPFVTALGVLVAWASWGLWPLDRASHKRRD